MPFELYLIIGYLILFLVNVALYRHRHHKPWALLDIKKDKKKWNTPLMN